MTKPFSADEVRSHALAPVPSIERSTSMLASYTVWIDYPNAGVDRPRTHGISVLSREQGQRLCQAIVGGVFVQGAEILTDTNGHTYVSHATATTGKYLESWLVRNGY